MATTHANFQDFSCSDRSKNPKTVKGLVRRVDELSRARGAHLTNL
jgi:hypothetical protein